MGQFNGLNLRDWFYFAIGGVVVWVEGGLLGGCVLV